MTTPPAWQPPAEFDEYRLVGPLGKGGMGQVYVARDLFLDRTVAVKFLLDVRDAAGALERFRIEARAIARLQHPNVVVVHRIGEAAGYPYIVSEHIRGTSLADVAKPVPWQRALEIGLGLARGLAAAHARGVLHRDIKGANAMLDEDGGVKLLDFGLAKLTVASRADGAPAAPTPPGAGASPRVRLATDPAIHDSGALDHTRRPDGAIPDATLPDAATTLAAPAALRHVDTPASPAPGDDTAQVTPSGGALAEDVSSITHAGALLGTPMYMSPEAWRADPLTAASDVYSLGVVLYELCAGKPPHKGLSLAQLAATVSAQDATPLRRVVGEVDAELAAVVDRCLARDPARRYPTASELRDALEQLAATGRGDAIPEGNPYRGLHAFEAEHRTLFFGRDHAIREVLERLRGEPFVLVAGDSGTGKSSLCRAGVIPAVLDGALGDGRRWRVARLMPSAHPLQALVAAIALAARLDEAELLAATQLDPAALGRAVRRAAGDDDGVLILVDQLEELVTVSDPAESELVVDAIRQLVIASPAIRVLATVRGDFLTRVAARFGRPEEIVRAVHLLLAPGRDDLRSAIVGPARLKGVTFESDALVDELVEAGARAEGGLPLLQFALAQLWHARAGGEKVIRAATLAAIGGVGGALARHADEVLARLLPGPREAARRILLRLVTALGTRARRAEAELVDGDPAALAALDALVRGRLIVAREGDDGTVYEVAHEALIHGWAALREWHEQSRDARAVAERLERAASEWERLGRPAEALWGDRQLAELALLDSPGRDAAFVDASRRALRRQRWIRRGLVIAVPIVVASVWLGIRFSDRLALDEQVRRRVHAAETDLARAGELASEAAALRTDAYAKFDAADAQAEAVWSAARERATAARDAYTNGSRTLEAALLLDPDRDAVRRRLATITYARMLLAEAEHDEAQLADLRSRLELWDVGGAQRASWDRPATISLATPTSVPVTLERYVDREGRLEPVGVAAPPQTPITNLQLPPGSYRFTFTTRGAPVRYPVLLARGEQFAATVALPDPAAVPRGFVHVPEGRFLFGYSGDEDLRRYFFYAPPMHPRSTAAFLIATHEVTFADWIAFLDEQPAASRSTLGPRLAGAGTGTGFGAASVELAKDARGWRLAIQPTTLRMSAYAGEPLAMPGKDRPVDWRQLPVSAVSSADADAYIAWLRTTGRLPRAKLCSDLEWTRAARGADARVYPSGQRLTPAGARIFDTQAQPDLATVGPDVVGSYASSPWDVFDLAGNVWDLVRTGAGGTEARGGSWYNDAFTARVINRQPVDASMRDLQVGLRICADP